MVTTQTDKNCNIVKITEYEFVKYVDIDKYHTPIECLGF